jgi:2,3-bisphosphoglycerate-dependent phosphoglycerate mutase
MEAWRHGEGSTGRYDHTYRSRIRARRSSSTLRYPKQSHSGWTRSEGKATLADANELPYLRLPVVTVIFETHAISEDNERGVASGWADSPLSPRGRALAQELGTRRRDDGIGAVFSSDLRRARETVATAFSGHTVPVFLDWRLRECDYGALNGGSAAQHAQGRGRYVDHPYPGGESWRDAVERVGGCLDDLLARWEGARVLLVGHVATRWALDHYVDGVALETLVMSDFAWQEGWEYHLAAAARQPGH